MTSTTKFYRRIQITLPIWSCDQSLVTLGFLREKFNLNFIRILPKKPNYFEDYSWLKFINLGLALGMTLKFYTSVTKGLKLKVKRVWRLIPTFIEVTG